MRRTNMTLWVVQSLLALMFLSTGIMKLVMPAAVLAPMAAPLPVLFIRFIGLCELAGALGLIVPSITGIRPSLTPIAASALVIIMSGATAVSLTTGHTATAWVPALLGCLNIFVAYGRFHLAPLGSARRLQGRSTVARAA
jgi:DoxX-like family